MADTQQDGRLAAPQAVKRYQGRVARIHSDGDPLEYPHFPPPHDKQYRDAAGLREIANQLKTVRPLTLLHPDDLISRGAKADVIGFVLGDQIDGDHAVPWIYITDPRGEQALKDGIRELSLGYTKRLDARGRQRDIQVDHVALVPGARCGSSCAVGMDCVGETGCYCNIRAISYSRLYMAAPGDKNEDLNARERQAPPAGGQVPPTDQKEPHAMDEMQKQLTAALKDAVEQRERAARAEGELQNTKTALTAAQADAANARADVAAEKKLTEAEKLKATQAVADAASAKEQVQKDSAASMDAAVQSRVKLLTEANKVLGDKNDKGVEIDRVGMPEQEIRLAVITQVDGAEFVTSLTEDQKKNPVFVQGLYTGALARHAKVAGSRTGTLQHLNQIRNDGMDAARRAAGGNPGPGPQSDGVPVDAEQRERTAMINRTRRAQ